METPAGTSGSQAAPGAGSSDAVSPGASEMSAPALGASTPGANSPPSSANGAPANGAPADGMPSPTMPLAPSAPPPAMTEPAALPPADLASLVWAIGSEGIGPSQFLDARAVRVDGSGNIYVAEYGGDGGSARVQRFSADGSFSGQWFLEDDVVASGLVVPRSGALHILQGGVVYQYDGQLGSKLGLLVKPDYAESPQAIARTPDDGLVTVARDQILRFDSQLRLVLDIEGTVEPPLENSFLLDGATMDGNGNLYVVASNDDAVYKFDPQGNFRDRIGSRGTGPGQSQTAPDSVAVDGRGRIYANDFDGINVFSADAVPLGIIPAGSAFGMVVSDANELIVVDRNEYRLLKYALPG